MLKAIYARINNEPALVLGAVQAALTVAVVFGVRLTPEQIAGVLTLSGALLALLTRQLVVPAKNVVATIASQRPPMIPPAPRPPTNTDPPEAA